LQIAAFTTLTGMLTFTTASFQEFHYVPALSAFEFVNRHFQSPDYAVTFYYIFTTTDKPIEITHLELRQENR
jgi:hypothetical protein